MSDLVCDTSSIQYLHQVGLLYILNIPFTGTLGLLLDAKKIGLIRNVGPVLDKLTALHFRLAPHTRKMILRKADELST